MVLFNKNEKCVYTPTPTHTNTHRGEREVGKVKLGRIWLHVCMDICVYVCAYVHIECVCDCMTCGHELCCDGGAGCDEYGRGS